MPTPRARWMSEAKPSTRSSSQRKARCVSGCATRKTPLVKALRRSAIGPRSVRWPRETPMTVPKRSPTSWGSDAAALLAPEASDAIALSRAYMEAE